MWWLTVLILFLSLLIYFLLAKICLEIDSRKEIFQLRFDRLAIFRIILIENNLAIEIQILVWKKKIDLFTARDNQKAVAKKKVKKAKRALSFKKIWAVLKSFKIKTFYLNVDFGNVQVDGILFSLFYWLGIATKKDIRINFLNENEIILRIENNMARMIWAFVVN